MTRPREHAGPLATGLERLGADVSVVPLIEVAPLDDVGELRRLVEHGDHDWIVFTSTNAVGAVGSVVTRVRARVAAVGPATASAVRALGVEPAFVPDRFASAEIADGLVVKPALGYLDVVRRVHERHPELPLAAYNVSGEYAMVKAAAANGWLDERAAVLEILTGIRRAGADLVVTYHAKDAASWLQEAR